ncbi:MAG: bifunctional 4-hydroxy-2-oxoglutarate aldolase/2-dehydro-3-deoxy-phosphogluconate aldolase [Bacteroidetes bacterium]|nr:bifunctional 4-hydroxy-2-oxoglutarate aldolase/2-dehydro-3-deoxy-phosphogluconate aldolase [Bacteroidota bacterium]
MNKQADIQQLIISQGLLPLFYHDKPDVSVDVLRNLYAAGIRVVEYTNRGEYALDNFMLMKRIISTELPGMKLGIGTVKTKTDAEIFIAAGADFIICPIVNPEVAKITHHANLSWIPGCMTPTEIHLAEANGAMMVKVFPGNLLGPSYIQSVKEIFPGLSFMPTGGVEVKKENLQSWFNAGVVAVGMGSKLISKAVLENKNYEELLTNTKLAMQLIGECRK